jgi:hypothetical protein
VLQSNINKTQEVENLEKNNDTTEMGKIVSKLTTIDLTTDNGINYQTKINPEGNTKYKLLCSEINKLQIVQTNTNTKTLRNKSVHHSTKIYDNNNNKENEENKQYKINIQEDKSIINQQNCELVNHLNEKKTIESTKCTNFNHSNNNTIELYEKKQTTNTHTTTIDSSLSKLLINKEVMY